MSNVLLTFGDSWPAGTKLASSDNAYPKIIASTLDMELIDLSARATSIEHVVSALFYFLENTHNPANTYTALFSLTDISRSMGYRAGDWEIPARDGFWKQCEFTFEFHNSRKTDEVTNFYYKHIHSTRLELYNYHKNVTLLKLLCEKYNIKDFYVHNWYDPNFEFKIVNKDRFYPHTLTQIINSKTYKEYIPTVIPEPEQDKLKRPQHTGLFIGPDGHPNPAGHDRIAEVLAEWIKTYV